MIRPHRTHALWLAFILHRLSGVGLALFLPVHFYMLSQLTDLGQLDGFLALLTCCLSNGLNSAWCFCWLFTCLVDAVDGFGISALESSPEDPCGDGGSAGIFCFNRFFPTGGLGDLFLFLNGMIPTS